MTRIRRLLVAAIAICSVAGACTSVPPTGSPAEPSPTAMATPSPSPRPLMTGPAWAQAAAERWEPGSAQWIALSHPDVPYGLGGSSNANPGGISYTPAQARLWWDQWFAAPVDLREVDPGLLPSNLVLNAEEMGAAHGLLKADGVLPKASRDFNPLGLPVVP